MLKKKKAARKVREECLDPENIFANDTAEVVRDKQGQR